MLGNSWLAVQLVASQEGISSMSDWVMRLKYTKLVNSILFVILVLDRTLHYTMWIQTNNTNFAVNATTFLLIWATLGLHYMFQHFVFRCSQLHIINYWVETWNPYVHIYVHRPWSGYNSLFLLTFMDWCLSTGPTLVLFSFYYAYWSLSLCARIYGLFKNAQNCSDHTVSIDGMVSEYCRCGSGWTCAILR
jgi:hypothetical protein